MNLKKLLPIPEGKSFTEWAESWMQQVKTDIYSIIEDDPDAVKRRNERYGAYLAYLSTVITIYRMESRRIRDEFHKNNPKPDKGVTEWNEKRDSITSKYRYTHEFLVSLREDIQKRMSASQTNLGVYKEEMKAQLD